MMNVSRYKDLRQQIKTLKERIRALEQRHANIRNANQRMGRSG